MIVWLTALALNAGAVLLVRKLLAGAGKPAQADGAALAVLLLLPGAGAMMLLAGGLMNRPDAANDFEGLLRMPAGERNGRLSDMDVNRERNTISLDDAVLMESEEVRRNLLMDCLKDDAVKHAAVLKRALVQDDAETAHYAASGLQDIMSRQTGAIQTGERELAEAGEADRPRLLRRQVRLISQAIDVNLYDAVRTDRLRATLRLCLNELIDSGPGTGEDYRLAVRNLLEMGRMNEALERADENLKNSPEAEEPYVLKLGVHYRMKDAAGMRCTLAAMKASPVRFSAETLATMRYWMTEAEPTTPEGRQEHED